ncbi:MAG: NrfD/PsrC family molybdoenzyme membrane anchor subunit [Archaeoglobaceae archaeon]|nr:NrfD/PsrC family molybdoenzyme membrane anchor subunit [Archaeoglobaceae archaeon]
MGEMLKKVEAVFVSVSIVLIVLGFVSVYLMHFPLPIPIKLPIEPFEPAEGIPWRLLVALYVFFVVSTTGLCIVASLGEVFGFKKLEPIVKEGLLMALVTILVDLVTVGLEIEQVTRGYFVLAGHANPMSMMYRMIMLYVLYVVFLLVEMWLYFRDDLLKQREERGLRGLVARILTTPKLTETKDLTKVVGFLTVFTAIIAHSNLGALFGVNYISFWHGPFLPIYFILSAVVSGAALTIIGAYIADYFRGIKIEGERYEAFQMLRIILGFTIVVTMLFTAWKFIVKAYPTSTLMSRESVEVFVHGNFAFNFWILEVLIGLVVPLILLTLPHTGRKVEWIFLASLFTIVGIFFLRIDLVMGGLALKHITGMNFPSPVYHPFEVFGTVGFLSLAAFLYYIGYKLLPMEVKK